MGNLCSIFHDRHDRLKLLTGSPAKAEFLSQCVYWWQISTYKIKNSHDIWFTLTTEDLAKKARLSESSVSRYLAGYVKDGLMEKRVLKRYSKKHGHEITCLHLRITEKLLKLLLLSDKTPALKNEDRSESQALKQTDDSGIVKLTVPFNKENLIKENNTDVRKKNAVNFVDKKNQPPKPVPLTVATPSGLERQVKGMMVNVMKTQAKISSPQQVYAEILFSLHNPQQFKSVVCIRHKINIIASLLKKNAWKTPFGFHKYRQSDKVTENPGIAKSQEQDTLSNLLQAYEETNAKILGKGELINGLFHSLKEKQQGIPDTRATEAKGELAALYSKQKVLEEKLGLMGYL